MEFAILVVGLRLTLLTVLLSGCAGVAPGQNAAPTAIESPMHIADWNATDCVAGLLGAFPQYERVMPWLPSGFTPREARDLVSSPVDMGRAMVVVAVIHCANGTDRTQEPTTDISIGVFVEPPDGAPETFDFYDVAHVTSPWLAKEYEWAGWATHPSTAEWLGAAADTGTHTALGGTMVEFDDGLGTDSLDITGILPQDTADWTARFWQAQADELRVLQFEFTSDWLVGSATCTFESGSWAARVTGMEQCGAQPPTVGMYWSSFDPSVALERREALF